MSARLVPRELQERLWASLNDQAAGQALCEIVKVVLAEEVRMSPQAMAEQMARLQGLALAGEDLHQLSREEAEIVIEHLFTGMLHGFGRDTGRSTRDFLSYFSESASFFSTYGLGFETEASWARRRLWFWKGQELFARDSQMSLFAVDGNYVGVLFAADYD